VETPPASPARPGAFPAYRFQVTPQDSASPGTQGNSPRAELFSVDNEEKHRRQTPPQDNVFYEANEFWTTFSIYIPNDFPDNHKWATLYQCKFQDDDPQKQALWPSWFTLDVHDTKIEMSAPGDPRDQYRTITTLDKLKGQWTQFTLHEKLSAQSDGIGELYMRGLETKEILVLNQSTKAVGDIQFHIQYGYYRSNDPSSGQSQGPGPGVIYYTPLTALLGKLKGEVPTLP